MAVRNTLLGIGSLIVQALTSFSSLPGAADGAAGDDRPARCSAAACKLSRASQDRIADLGSYLDGTPRDPHGASL